MDRIPAFRFLCTVVAWSLGLAWAAPASAYTPRYTVKKSIRQSDLDGNGLSSPIAVTGLNKNGLLVGYYSCFTSLHGVPRQTVQAFVWDDATQQLLDIGHDDLAANASVATCVNDFGAVAGTYWSGGTVRQHGFIWQAGNVTYIDSPDGGNIDAVTAISPTGQVTGTYFPVGGNYKRAFLWNGVQTIDLGDLGDPDYSFVWPVSINSNFQIVGTIYTQHSLLHPPPTTAFRWENEVMLPLDDEGTLINTAALGLNQLGQIVGTYYLPPPHPGMPAVPSSFSWNYDLFTDLGSLGGGGTKPFAIDNTSQVFGTSYTSDHTLHLFSWASPAGALADFGVAQLTPTDTGFQLTSVNQRGDVAGFITDAQGQTQVYVRPVGTAAANLSALALPYNTLDCTPDDAGGSRVLLNESGLLAYSGYDHTGEPVVVLLTPDSDNDGLPDGWEVDNFGDLSQTAEGDYDRDFTSNYYEYLYGTDPTDYYNGHLPVLRVVGGGDQRGAPGTVLPQPLTVCMDYSQQNAPLTYAVTNGGALLSATSGGPFTPTMQTRATVQYVDGFGRHIYAAQVYVKLPTANGASTVTAYATIKDGTTSSVSTTELTSNPNLQPPSAPGLEKNSATTADINWVPSDPTLPTMAEASYDGGATWHGAGTFPAGVTRGTVKNLVPNHVIYLRLVTVGGGSDGKGESTASAGLFTEELGSPVVMGEQATLDRHNYGWPDFVNGSKRYSTKLVKQYIDGGEVGTMLYKLRPPLPTIEPPPGPGMLPAEIEYNHATTSWEVLGAQHGFNLGWSADARVKEDVHLDDLYDLDMFRGEVEALVPGFHEWLNSGTDEAWLHLWEAMPPPPDPSNWDPPMFRGGRPRTIMFTRSASWSISSAATSTRTGGWYMTSSSSPMTAGISSTNHNR